MFQANYAVDSERMNPSQDYNQKVFSKLGLVGSGSSLADLINDRYVVSVEGVEGGIPNDFSESNIDLREEVQNNQKSPRITTFSFLLEQDLVLRFF